MSYVDGYLIAVPVKNKAAYLKLAKDAARVFKANGALAVVECWGDDVPDGKVTSFPMALKLKNDEAVVFSWVTWPSKAARDAGVEAAKKDPLFSGDHSSIPFDGQRMIFGGFETILEV